MDSTTAPLRYYLKFSAVSVSENQRHVRLTALPPQIPLAYLLALNLIQYNLMSLNLSALQIQKHLSSILNYFSCDTEHHH